MRVKNWPSVLARFIEEHRNMSFAWGTNDCALFAADAVIAITGQDPAKEYRGRYKTEGEVQSILESEGGLRAIATACLGPEIDPKMAQRGDVVLIVDGKGQDVLSICLGASFAAPGEAGLKFFKIKDAISAWRVT